LSTGPKPDRFDAIARNFYWANVVRFFAGCFTKGELLDLAERVKTLIDDPVLGQTRQPILLAAMLLSDWVFELSPKAIGELTAPLSQPDQLLKLLPYEPFWRRQEIVQIAPECGGGSVARDALRLLESTKLKPDMLQRLGAWLRLSLPREALDRWWSDKWGGVSTSPEVDHWLRVGGCLETLERAPTESLVSCLDNRHLSRAALEALVEAGRRDVLMSSAHLADALINFFLNDPVAFSRSLNPNWPADKPPFYLLPLLATIPYRWAKMGRDAYGFRFDPEFIARVQTVTVPSEANGKEFATDALRLSHAFIDFENDQGNESRLSPLERVLDAYWQTWGDRPFVFMAASALCQRLPAPRGRPRQVDLSDHHGSILDRVRYAKSRNRDPAWWSRQLAAAGTLSEKELFHVAFWTMVSVDSVVALAKEIARDLDSMSPQEWGRLLFLFEGRVGFAMANSRDQERLPQGITSRRFSLMLALKDPKFVRSAFAEHFMEGLGEQPEESHFRVVQAFQWARSGTVQWDKALNIAKSEYANHYEDTGARYVNSHVALPDSVVKAILDKPRQFPLWIWDGAIANATASARKAVRPVGRVAQQEGWFRR